MKKDELKINKEILDTACEHTTCFNRENCLRIFKVCPAQNAVFQTRKQGLEHRLPIPTTGLN